MALPELIGAAEAAEILEISSTNLAHHRAKLKAAGDDSFPEPAATLRMGPIWVKRDIVRYKSAFEGSRRRRRSPAEVAADKAEKEQAKAAETSPATVAAPKRSRATKTVDAQAPAAKTNGKAANGKTTGGKLSVRKSAASPKTSKPKLKLV